MQGLFIAGTDTGVGKTEVGSALIRGLVELGVQVAARKPAESGCSTRHGILWPEDGARLRVAAGYREPLRTITPWRFVHALAPDRAARLAGTPLHLEQLIGACRLSPDRQDIMMIVEGAGGILSPMAEDGLNIDLALGLGFPVLLVTTERLGVINQVLLAVEAIERRGLCLSGVVLNNMGCDLPEGIDNHSDLTRRIRSPILSYSRTDGLVVTNGGLSLPKLLLQQRGLD